MLAASMAKLMTFKRACRKYMLQKSALTMSARSTYSELVRDPKLESPFTTPSSLRFNSFLQVTNPPPLQVNLWTRLMARALEPFLREATAKGWFFDSNVGSGHSFFIAPSIATSARRRNKEMRQSTIGTLSAQGFGSFFWNLQAPETKGRTN